MFEQTQTQGEMIAMEKHVTGKSPKQAVIYARPISQREKHSSLTNKMEPCQAYCNAHGYTICHIYQEEGISGLNRNRPGLDALRATEDRDGVVIDDSSQISRNIVYVATSLHDLEAKHIQVETVISGDDSDLANFALAVMKEMEIKTTTDDKKAYIVL